VAARAAGPAPGFDVCLADHALRSALEDLAIGRWAGPRDLLAETGRDWDRRTHRVRVLADAAVGSKCVEAWQIAEPNCADAWTARAEVEVARCFHVAVQNGGEVPAERLDTAVRAGLVAANADADDPVPLVSLLTVARLYPGGHPRIEQWWDELQRRDPYNREACHQVMRYFSDRYHGSDRMAQDFARDVAGRCPLGLPLSVLPLAARVEAYRFRIAGRRATDLDVNDMWIDAWAGHDLDIALGRWFTAAERTAYAQDVPDLHYLGHGLVFANRLAQAAPVFDEIGGIAVATPWSLFGDPAALIGYWRQKAYAAAERLSR
jgi:hypothetical protein